jgi:hypothetical protein
MTREKAERGMHLEVRGWAEGIRLGREHAGDPWALARALGAVVQYGAGPTMRAGGRDGWCLTCAPGEPSLIMLADDLRPYEVNKVLAHECGHVVLHGADVERWSEERAAEAFAREFLAQRPENAVEKAIRMKREQEERARNAARLEALLRRERTS